MHTAFPLIAGLIASILHVIMGPDHLAAVMPFAVESKKGAWKIGLSWGFGHLTGMMLIGALFYFFKGLIPINNISSHSEQLVGVVLIAIGAWFLYSILKKKKSHEYLHSHSENSKVVHSHIPSHNTNKSHSHSHDFKVKKSSFSSFSIGLLHGLAGIAHFLLFLPVLGFENQSDVLVYIIGFGGGTLLAMTSFAFIVGNISSYVKMEHNELYFKGIRIATSFFAVVIGIYWLLRV